ncbi:MAG: FCD domain-containing protein [Minwuia sp.]|nr:FCD domain-containing protein [Minwuia sp.]
MDDIGKIEAKKGFETLAEAIREQILSGTIAPGEVLNELEFVEKSGLSRGSVREAFRVLETQGLVSTRRGRNGGRVAMQLNGDVLRRSLDMFIRGKQVPISVLAETIQVFAPALAELAARHRTDDDIKVMLDILEELSKMNDTDGFVATNIRWHLAVSRASHNPILSSVYQIIGPDLLTPEAKGFVTARIRTTTVAAEHLVLDAIIARDGDVARRRMENHIRAYIKQLELKLR